MARRASSLMQVFTRNAVLFPLRFIGLWWEKKRGIVIKATKDGLVVFKVQITSGKPSKINEGAVRGREESSGVEAKLAVLGHRVLSLGLSSSECFISFFFFYHPTMRIHIGRIANDERFKSERRHFAM